ncbi:MAG: T9SS type A sorting domain-containing protein [Saprospiraceae bacterium]|jgi:photosystem II stability/assembly factor-like uncharacterized protein|uniref:T9SS type A sorting domain-containing protein n=1 Tax=Candidatus Brachybacter algidus TaxID=2982024 RepID=UPI001B4733B1|nr:T9SS type A sorting domain-containing protein [Candidatus Brachybacter algidus]MBP6540184.1 T9SS type A sorting domain-containing protein [Saprospiraceae bacterium]MBK6375093.1 T9SS type A sorting domain-containing protein [Candidatus Brachybacter algidus]MBK6450499.1 T9SS type A sorting domain-containing protein [Candidatus Brachybacter algidus]MBK7605300.1 T9SS type A sorting domain-containing protein [Candidatus Brachybacter algidus]MBK8748265.1 T9SS type A sorting domain-containing prot
MKKILLVILTLAGFNLSAQDFQTLYPDNNYSSVYNIALHASGMGYAVQRCSNLLKTDNGGNTWTETDIDIDATDIYGINQLYSVNSSNDNQWIYFNKGGIYYTDNNFNTVKNVTPILNGNIRDFKLQEDESWVLLADNNLYISEDLGETWKVQNQEPVYGSYLFLFSKDIYTCDRNIYRSEDDGRTFDTVHVGSILFRSMAINSFGVFAATIDEVFASNNGGSTWNKLSATDYYGSGENFQTMGDTLITSTSNRINFSADGGNTWYSQVMGQNIYRTRALFIHADHSIFIGGEHGQIFKTKKPTIPLSVKNGRVGFLDYVVAQGDRIVAMSSFGVVVYSNDGGENWAEKQLTNDNIGGLIFVGDRLMGMDNHGLIEFDENFDVTIKAALDHWASDMEYSQVMNTLYLTTANTLMMTSDEGSTLQTIFETDNDLSSVSVDDDGIVYVATNKGEIFYSKNNGSSWNLLYQLADEININDIQFDDVNNGYLITANYCGYLTDEGATYKKGNGPSYISNIVKRKDGHIIIRSNTSDISAYGFIPNSAAYKTLAEDCFAASTNACFDETSKYLYIIGSGLTIKRTELASLAVKDHDLGVISTQLYPNPSNGMIFTDKIALGTKIRFMNAGGSVCKILVNSKNADLTALAKGVYLAQWVEGNVVKNQKLIIQ